MHSTFAPGSSLVQRIHRNLTYRTRGRDTATTQHGAPDGSRGCSMPCAPKLPPNPNLIHIARIQGLHCCAHCYKSVDDVEMIAPSDTLRHLHPERATPNKPKLSHVKTSSRKRGIPCFASLAQIGSLMVLLRGHCNPMASDLHLLRVQRLKCDKRRQKRACHHVHAKA